MSLPRPRLRRASGAVLALLLCVLLLTSVSQAAPATLQRIEHEALLGGGQVVYVLDVLGGEAGQPWLAVGWVVDSDGNRTPSAWTSDDGATWSRFAMEASGAPEARDGPYAVARRGNVAVAVGERFDTRVRQAAWWSTASTTWTAIKDPADPLLGFEGTIEAVSAGPLGFVAVGYQHNPSNTTFTLFRSTDGRAWTIDTWYTTPPGERFIPLDVASFGTREVVVGVAQLATGATDGRIWVEAPTGSWQSIDPGQLGLSGPGFQNVGAVEWHPTLGLVAGGAASDGNVETPTLWHSTTGDTWERLPPLEGGVAAVHDIAVVPGGFVAAGSSNAGPRVWRSSDGRTWVSVPTPLMGTTAGKKIATASDGSKIVYVVTADTGSQMFHRVGSEWQRADRGPGFPSSKPRAALLLDVAASRGRIVAVGSDGNGKPLVMTSRGGASWTRAALADNAAQLLAVAAYKGTFTIAGWRLLRGRAYLALWTSRTGTAWRRIGGSRDGPVGAFVDLAATSSGLLALAFEPGQRGLLTTVWASRRGVWRPAAELGPGIATGLCAGPHGVVAVAAATQEPGTRIKVWSRPPGKQWSVQPDIVASQAAVSHCADGPKGTVVVGSDENFAAVSWTRIRPGERWVKSVVGSSAPRTEILEVIREGPGFLATGTSGGRGQADLAIWRSSDGTQWARLAEADPISLEPGYQAGVGIVKIRDGVVVVGQHGAGNAGIWVGAP
ncbi:MAG: hypothetical protein ACRDOF_09590 [Gaiellaceae bacterium]